MLPPAGTPARCSTNVLPNLFSGLRVALVPFLLYSIAAENVEFAGQESVSEYFMSDWGARGFCRACGTTLYWRMRDRGVTSLAVGLLDDQAGLALTEEIFCDRRPEWLPAVPGSSQSTEADEMQKLVDYMARKSGE